jgi:hypothetical protein
MHSSSSDSGEVKIDISGGGVISSVSFQGDFKGPGD